MTSADRVVPVTEDLVRQALDFVSPDCSRDEWVNVAFALADEFGANGFALFDDWSRDGKSYDRRAARGTWKSVCGARGGAGRRVTIGTVFGLAQRAGFRFELSGDDLERAREERAKRRRESDEQAALAARQRAEEAKRAALESGGRWAVAARDGSSIYLRRKGILGAESVRFEPDGTLLVPMVRYDLPREQALVGVQAIRPDGEKRFARGTAKAGSACRLGLVVEGEPILLGEGYATGMSLRMALDRRLPVFVAFDAGNLEPVAAILRALHPRCQILVCADDDWRTTGNPGRTKAAKLAKSLPHTHWIYPVWSGERADKDTDFNDLHRAAGLPVVAAQLRGPLQWLAKEGRRAA